MRRSRRSRLRVADGDDEWRTVMRSALVALAFVACGGGGDARPVAAPAVHLVDGSLDELTSGRKTLVDALAASPTDAELIARIAELDGLLALLYGVPPPEERVFAPVAKGQPGHRSWMIGKVAFELTRARTAPEGRQLAELIGGELGPHLDQDPWLHWLAGRVELVRGSRTGAGKKFETSKHPLAKIDHANLVAEDARTAEAVEVLARDTHVLSVTMRAVFRAERGDVAGAVADLELVKTIDAPRVVAYRHLATAMVGLANERYDLAADALGKLGKIRALPNECALWERIAWAHLQLGRSVDKTNDHKIASLARQRCATLGPQVGDNKLLLLVDANLGLGLGKLDQAEDRATVSSFGWARVIRAEVELERGRAREALDGLERGPVDKADPARPAAEILTLQARAQLATGKARSDLLAQLAADADSAKSQRARHALGAAYFAIGDLAAAKRELRRAVEETTAESPNPLAFRTHQLLAEIGLATDDVETAAPEIERALEIHPGNAMTRVIQARIYLRNAKPDKALEALAPLRSAGALIPAAKLVVAEALVAREDVTAEHRTQARALIGELVGKIHPAELGRVAALVDPALPKQLGLPVGKPPKQGT